MLPLLRAETGTRMCVLAVSRVLYFPATMKSFLILSALAAAAVSNAVPFTFVQTNAEVDTAQGETWALTGILTNTSGVSQDMGTWVAFFNIPGAWLQTASPYSGPTTIAAGDSYTGPILTITNRLTAPLGPATAELLLVLRDGGAAIERTPIGTNIVPGTVPEPAGLAALALGASTLLRRRKR
ncbi:PEP-CTERM sorting domain-containing protein [bacterium]|nr:MAG: PEP-CTERM sorting domain-containing protein [bacterium]